MKNILFLLTGLLILNTTLAAQDLEKIRQYDAKVEEIVIESEELDQTRQILIYTPQNYAFNDIAYYNVLYVFDAHDRPLYDYVTGVSHLVVEGARPFIVVGIKATFIQDKMYARNHDFLPSSTTRNMGPKSAGNAENFLAYVKNEVLPYVESNYRVLPHRTAVGHSLGASFLVYSMLHEPELFQNYIAVSPNLADDKERLVRGLENFDSRQFENPHYFYMSHAEENTDERYRGWEPANRKAYKILQDDLAHENFMVKIEEYPEESHRSNYAPSVASGLKTLIEEVLPKQDDVLSGESYEVTLRITATSEEEELYLAGNQPALANWQTGQVKMNRISELEREITLTVQEPVKFKIYRGSGEQQAWLKFGEEARTSFPVLLRPRKDGEVYTYEVDDF